jgi:hypothetical protein
MPRHDPKKVKDLRPGDIIRGTVHECAHCGTWFIARSDAVVCSNVCRVMRNRAANKTP